MTCPSSAITDFNMSKLIHSIKLTKSDNTHKIFKVLIDAQQKQVT